MTHFEKTPCQACYTMPSGYRYTFTPRLKPKAPVGGEMQLHTLLGADLCNLLATLGEL